jgi:glycerol-3-phosphate O-acyltransferase
MDKKSTFEARLEKLRTKFPVKYYQILCQFLDSYKNVTNDYSLLIFFIDLLEELMRKPFSFEPYHKKVRHPIDYYKFSLDFVGPFVDVPHSTVQSAETVAKIKAQLKNGENCILLANHQTEADPQIISMLLDPELAEKIIYVAGERVVTDPLAIPFSMGTDLLCIYSKRYIDNPPELKTQKQLHNKNTMELMSRLLQEGGKIIYVAPSGGRDRRNAKGEVEVAPFDPSSIEMFHLMARKAKTPTHFYPLSLDTYHILPPPETIQAELGETRIAKRCPAHLYFAPEFDMDHFPGSDATDKTVRRQNRADAIWKIVQNNYLKIST